VRTGSSGGVKYYGLKEFNISVVNDGWYDYVYGKEQGDIYIPSLYNDVDPSFDEADITLNISNNLNSPNLNHNHLKVKLQIKNLCKDII
jgi:hypothetical protein